MQSFGRVQTLKLKTKKTILAEPRNLILLPLKVIHIHLFYKGQVIVFERDDGFLGPVSGRLKIRETFLDAAYRELYEETDIQTLPGEIHPVLYSFNAFSPNKIKPIYGKPFFTVLPDAFSLEQIHLNQELETFSILNPVDALKALEENGHPEAFAGLREILTLNSGIFNKPKNWRS